MTIEDLKREFILEGDAQRVRLEPIISKAMAHCKVDKQGQVLLLNPQLSAKQQVKLILAARAIASQLEPLISAEVTTEEIRKFSGLPPDQVRARGRDAIAEKFAQSASRGTYRAFSHKIEDFLDSLAKSARGVKND
jgi:hypothetical protein